MRWLLLALFLASPAWADSKPGQIYPGVVSGSLTLTTGGTAQTLVAAQSAYSPLTCLINNPQTAADQGISAAENAYVNPIGTAVAAGGGSTLSLEPGRSVVLGPQTGAISWIAATTGHKIEGFCWQ